MKYFFPALMAFFIMVGLGTTLTPFIAEQFFPTTQSRFQKANPDDTKEALATWFGISAKEFVSVEAIRYQAVPHSTRWYRFVTNRIPVERFIKRMHLEQLSLDETILQQEFMATMPPIGWWQPAALQRKSYFRGRDGLNIIKLIYNAESNTGYLLVETDLPEST